MLPLESGIVGITPTAKIRKQAGYLKIAMVAEAIVFAVLLVAGTFGAIIQLLTIGFGWYSIWDDNGYKPQLMQVFFFSSVFGAVFAGVSLALSVSALIETGAKTTFIGIGFWMAGLIVLVAASYLSWNIFKELSQQPLLITSSQPLNHTREHSSVTSAGPYNILSGGNRGSEQSEFVPFQGTGRKLGS